MADDFSDDDDDAFLKLCTQSQFSLSQEKENPAKGNLKYLIQNFRKNILVYGNKAKLGRLSS